MKETGLGYAVQANLTPAILLPPPPQELGALSLIASTFFSFLPAWALTLKLQTLCNAFYALS